MLWTNKQNGICSQRESEKDRENNNWSSHKNTSLQNGVIFEKIYFKFHCFRAVWCSFCGIEWFLSKPAIIRHVEIHFCEINLLNFIFYFVSFHFQMILKRMASGKSVHTFVNIISPTMKFWLENEFEEVVSRLHTRTHISTLTNEQTNVEQRFPYYLFLQVYEWMFIVKTILNTLCYNILAIALMQDYGWKRWLLKLTLRFSVSFRFVLRECVHCAFIQVFFVYEREHLLESPSLHSVH